jgi:hypothetical protein
MATTPTLRLINERKLADLLGPPRSGAVYEASGVIAVGKYCYVALDNIRRVARVALHLRRRSGDHRWMGRARQGEGYEAITYSRAQRRFYLMIEAQKHPDGTFKGVIEEYDDEWRFTKRRWIDFPLKKRNTGFEGLASVQWRGHHYLLALCEGNKCKDSHTKRKRGQGRIHVLEPRGGVWKAVAQIKLPKAAAFKDYADMALDGDRIAVVSQESSRVWVGRVRRGQWAIAGKGRVYELPRTKKGKKRYFTVEGISWLSPRTLVAVSDKTKKSHPNRGAKTEQSIHIFRIA